MQTYGFIEKFRTKFNVKKIPLIGMSMAIIGKKTIVSQDQVFWYLRRPAVESLRASVHADVAIIGGGMAGLTAAQAFAQKGKKVILLEAYYCGSGASGKSSGFITPNGELGITDFISRYGKEGGLAIWKRIQAGVNQIRSNIEDYSLDCDYAKQDSLFVANTQSAVKTILKEHEALLEIGYKSDYIPKKQMHSTLGSKGYYGGITYADNFGISAYKYCQEMKEVLIKQGVMIYEETPVLSFQENQINTLHATVTAQNIIACTDRFLPSLGKLTYELYHAQTFLLISQPLTQEEIKTIFPTQNYMVWDTDLIYNYYRINGNRLLLGGGSVLKTYETYETHNSNYMHRKLTSYFKKKFPQLTIQFEQMWPGLIGISKDIAPLAGRDKNSKSIYYIGGAAGLPVAAGLGLYCADHMIDGADDLKDYFSPYRSFPIGHTLQSIIGTKAAFAISNVIKTNVP